jgi:hypothetical protein
MVARQGQTKEESTSTGVPERPGFGGPVSPFGRAAWQRVALGLAVVAGLWLAITWAVRV